VRDLPGQAKHWPAGRASWTEQINVPIRIVPADQSPIAIDNSPEIDPKKTGAVKPGVIRVTRKGSGKLVKFDLSIEGSKTPCSFEAFARIAEKEYKLGSYVAYPGGSSSSELTCQLVSLDPSVKTADLILRPNPSLAEDAFGVERVWGGEYEIDGLPLTRYDLDGN